jgi:hypothetical protein
VKRSSKGSTLIIVLIIMIAVITTISIMADTLLFNIQTVKNYENSIKAFYLAEAGLEEAKSILVNNPYWFTDEAGVTKGLGSGLYTMVRRYGQNSIISTGIIRDSKVILKAEYREKPFIQTSFGIL